MVGNLGHFTAPRMKMPVNVVTGEEFTLKWIDNINYCTTKAIWSRFESIIGKYTSYMVSIPCYHD